RAGVVARRGCLGEREREGCDSVHDGDARGALRGALDAAGASADVELWQQRGSRGAPATVGAHRRGIRPDLPRRLSMDLCDYYDRHWTELPEGQVDFDRLRMITSRVGPGERRLEAGCGPRVLAELLRDTGAQLSR